MNSDLTFIPLEKKGGSILSLMGFITPLESVPLLTGQANPHTKDFGVGANEKNQIRGKTSQSGGGVDAY